MSIFLDVMLNSVAWTYGLCSIIFTVLLYPFSRKWTKGATKFIVDIQISAVMGSGRNREYLVQTDGENIVPLTTQRKPIFTLIMFNLFIVSLALGALPQVELAQCLDGTFIDSKFVNDGYVNCPDSSDEYYDESMEMYFGEPLYLYHADLITSVDWVLGFWGILLAVVGPIFLVFFSTRLIYEYCPVLIVDSKTQSITRFGDRKNRKIGPMIGSGAILITTQLVLREGWGSASFTEMGFVLLYIIFITMAISFGQIIALLLSVRRIRKEANDLALILLGFRLARSVKMNWRHVERIAKNRLIEYTKMPQEAVILSPELLTRYDLMDRYMEQRNYINSVKEEHGDAMSALLGLT